MAWTTERTALLVVVTLQACTSNSGDAAVAAATGSGGATTSATASSSGTAATSSAATTSGGGGDGGVASPDWGGGMATCTAPPGGPCAQPAATPQCVHGECFVPAGCYNMGSPPSEYGRGAYSEDLVEVTLTHCFWMQETEVSQALWTSFGLDNPSAVAPDGSGDCLSPGCPVGNVTWFDAMAFANLLSDEHEPPLPRCYLLEGCVGTLGNALVCDSAALTTATPEACNGYRVPSEAEWEYAARAGTTTAFYSGDIAAPSGSPSCHHDDDLDPIAWYCNTAADKRSHAGKARMANAWGLHDMLGNSWEWTQSWFKGLGYGSLPLTDPADALMPFSNAGVSTRGGAAYASAERCRAAAKLPFSYDARSPGIGMRLVRSVAP